MIFRIILVKNGVYKKTLYKCTLRKTAFVKFYEILESNKSVKFPRRFVNTKKISPVSYEIYVTKPTEDSDTFRTLRDKFGKLYTEKPIGDWTVLTSAPFELEETFWIYGNNPNLKSGRPTIDGVVKKLFVGAHKKDNIKQVIVVNNKLLIHNEDHFDMVICKCLDDAQRLHHTLAKAAKKQKIKNLIFMGTATPSTASQMFGVIKKNTGWKDKKIWKKSTRP